ncbi:bifunctional 5,10-methylenetetrahydrofolate dehydrogenase/5,10-methenyltetrahydrofolate cyclohydrolase [Candidatus Parcubacteria bacterium]|nr:bifunctional 5,10-methylenetetrahydrofolate dehydrogenase/5,10-methenyltetrahydrofolate cyclohydrolase [Candidatus Parcubacteria bacterium]
MSNKKIDGQILAEKIKDKITKEIFELGIRPNLAIILIGERSDSRLYVDLKEHEAKKVGIDTHTYKCPTETSEEEILAMINHLNEDELIDGILVQLPLPDKFNTDKIIKALNPNKDVDGFHPDNKNNIISPVHGTVLEMLNSISCDLKNKNIIIISNSKTFGDPLAKLLEEKNAITKVINSKDRNLAEETIKADILITAVGKPHFIKKEMIKDETVIIDIGITKKDTHVLGDVDYKNVLKKVSYITPVPGGVGPMTIAMLFKNTLKLYKLKH